MQVVGPVEDPEDEQWMPRSRIDEDVRIPCEDQDAAWSRGDIGALEPTRGCVPIGMAASATAARNPLAAEGLSRAIQRVASDRSALASPERRAGGVVSGPAPRPGAPLPPR